MIMKHRIVMDLNREDGGKQIDVMQDDQYSRELELQLLTNGKPYYPPQESRVLVRYQKSNGQGGAYDLLPNGREAWKIQGNILTVALAPQVCTVPGKVMLAVTLRRGSAELSCFTVCVNVGKIPETGMKSEEYYHINGFIPQPDRAAAGEYLKVAAVDEQGNITALTATAREISGSGIHIGGEVPADENVQIWIDPEGDQNLNIPTDEHIIALINSVLSGTEGTL